VALASTRAAALYGLVPVAERIEDHHGATTRFFVLGRHITEPSGADHTLLVVVPPDNKPGILVDLLSCLSSRRIDLTSAHSRPLRAELGAYCFALTLTGHVSETNMQAAIGELCDHGAHVRFLGSFPAWRGETPVAPFDRLPRSIATLHELQAILRDARG
ncbi:MAG TPA: prephenate dehydratase domain-containing protein, partial [Acidimicrobiales bacterium]|nr:prephenate dehydratase domain-containing protein [Acidimicrobiales bacterium]